MANRPPFCLCKWANAAIWLVERVFPLFFAAIWLATPHTDDPYYSHLMSPRKPNETERTPSIEWFVCTLTKGAFALFVYPVDTNPEKLSGQNGTLLERSLNVHLKMPGLRFSFVGKHYWKHFEHDWNFLKMRFKAGVLGNQLNPFWTKICAF